MVVDSFFEVIELQYNKQLPFVVYSRPINSIVKCWLQNDNTLYETSEFIESGFVFAPFDLSNTTVLFPKDKCKYSEIEVESLTEMASKASFKGFNPNVELAKSEHIALVNKGIDDIKNGSMEKVVLSRVETTSSIKVSPIELFKRLFNKYKNAMVYCWYHPKIGLWIGATPELLFKVEGKQLTTIALAGTQASDNTLDVEWSNKEIDEQQIVVDYIQNQIEPYSDSTKISEVETVKAGNLLHLKSRIISRIKPSANLHSIIEALHPTPAVCGFPKQASKEFILQNENYNREYYTGFLGELNLKQSKTRNTNRHNVENNAYSVVKIQSNFYVNLRCAQIKKSEVVIYVGGGITKDSNAEKEWQETVNKTKTIGSVLE